MQKQLLIFFVITAICMIIGCTGKAKKEGYKPVESKYSKGVLRAKLFIRGSYSSKEFDSIRASPYDLVFSFTPDDQKQEGAIRILKAKLIDLDGKEVFESSEVVEGKYSMNGLGSFRAGFSFQNIDLNYTSHTLYLLFEVLTGDNVKKEQGELVFQKDFQEYEYNHLSETLSAH